MTRSCQAQVRTRPRTSLEVMMTTMIFELYDVWILSSCFKYLMELLFIGIEMLRPTLNLIL